jgi:hypothetical protein
VHSFRIFTAVLAWVLIGVAFYYRPDWIKWGLRTATHGIEAVGDALPSPWGDRVEIILKRAWRLYLDPDHRVDHFHSCGAVGETGWRHRRRHDA